MLTFEESLQYIINETPVLPLETIQLEESLGRILQEDIISNVEMPPFDKSAMDGYAVYADDTNNPPAKIKCLDLIQAGESFDKKINPGEGVKIMTGASLPAETDSVVMIENTRQTGDSVEILKSVKQGENVCKRGEDIQYKQKVLSKGIRILPSHISLLATVGYSKVKVAKKPTVAVLNTGG